MKAGLLFSVLVTLTYVTPQLLNLEACSRALFSASLVLIPAHQEKRCVIGFRERLSTLHNYQLVS